MTQEEADRQEANRKTLGSLLVFSVLGAGLVGFCVTHSDISQNNQEIHKPKTEQSPVRNKPLLNNQQQKQR